MEIKIIHICSCGKNSVKYITCGAGGTGGTGGDCGTCKAHGTSKALLNKNTGEVRGTSEADRLLTNLKLIPTKKLVFTSINSTIEKRYKQLVLGEQGDSFIHSLQIQGGVNIQMEEFLFEDDLSQLLGNWTVKLGAASRSKNIRVRYEIWLRSQTFTSETRIYESEELEALCPATFAPYTLSEQNAPGANIVVKIGIRNTCSIQLLSEGVSLAYNTSSIEIT